MRVAIEISKGEKEALQNWLEAERDSDYLHHAGGPPTVAALDKLYQALLKLVPRRTQEKTDE